ncbi:MAG: YdbH domain-containing protein [Pseudomonadota bacterium]|nr:YdbH domain-containing protein [Pseudomonadota bacterium]
MASKKRRRWLWVFVFLLLVAGGCYLLIPRFLPPFLADRLTVALQQAGFPKARVEVTSLGLSRADLSIFLDPDAGQVFPRVDIHYPLASLLQMKARTITVHDLALKISVDSQGKLSVAGLALPEREQDDAGPLVIPALPFSELALKNAVIIVDSTFGPMTMTADAVITRDEQGALKVTGTGKLVHPLGETALTLEGKGRKAGNMEGNIAFTQDRAELPGMAARNLAGTVHATLSGQAGLQAALEASIQSVTGEKIPVTARDLSIKARYVPAEPVPLTAELAAGTVENTSDPPFLVPAKINATVTGNPSEALKFLSKADVAMGSLIVEAEGSHDMKAGQGKASVTLIPATLSEFASLPALSPWLSGHLDKITGTFGAKADLRWTGDGFSGKGSVNIKDGGLQRDTYTVSGLNGTVNISSLAPFSIPEKQTLTAKEINIGVPLTDASLQFGLSPKGVFALNDFHTGWSGGKLSVKPFRTDIRTPKVSTTLSAEKIRLEQILKLVNVEGLAATGIMTGSIPLRLEGDIIHLDHGVLEAEGSGTLGYNPSEPPSYLQDDAGSGTGILMQALTNFRYESLQATLDGTVGQTLTVGLKIRGANPEFYNGYPVSLNLALSGALDTIVRRSLETWKIPDAVQKQLLEEQVKE